jgi:hypothetical protein
MSKRVPRLSAYPIPIKALWLALFRYKFSESKSVINCKLAFLWSDTNDDQNFYTSICQNNLARLVDYCRDHSKRIYSQFRLGPLWETSPWYILKTSEAEYLTINIHKLSFWSFDPKFVIFWIKAVKIPTSTIIKHSESSFWK